MQPENIIKVLLIILFLLYAYFMIGGYVDLKEKYVLMNPNYQGYYYGDTCVSKCMDGLDKNFKNTIYQEGPYLNV